MDIKQQVIELAKVIDKAQKDLSQYELKILEMATEILAKYEYNLNK